MKILYLFSKAFSLDKIKFDFDQLQDENTILSTWGAWTSDRIGRLGETVYWNALAYSLHGNMEAGGTQEPEFTEKSR